MNWRRMISSSIDVDQLVVGLDLAAQHASWIAATTAWN
jgi:hypothetical protein